MNAIHEQAIVSALNKHPEDGFKMLMKKYQKPIYWHIRRLVVIHDDAQDATQETFIRIFRHLDQYDSNHSLSSWIYRIATNEALRIISKRNGKPLSIDESEEESIHIAADNYVDYSDLEAIRLQNAILSLPSKQQIAFNLRYYDELDYTEIANITGSTLSAVKANYHLAKEKIIKYMNSHD